MTISFVGAGPGDPRLLTLRGAELLALADVVVANEGVHEETMLRARDAERVHVAKGERPETIAALMIDRASAGKRVVRLFRGDSMLFGTGQTEVALVARAGQPIEIVAGVIVPTAAAAYAGLSLSSASDITPSVAFAVVPDASSLHDWKTLSLATDTLALLVDASQVDEVCSTLTYHGRSPDTPAGLVRDASLPTQRVAFDTLARIREHAAEFGAGEVLLLVGQPLAQREGLRWFDQRPLFGKRVLLTRPRDQGERTAAMLRDEGADSIVIPTIEVVAPADFAPLDRALAELETYDWIAFTSENGVNRAWDRLATLGKDARAFGPSKLAAIGPSTADALKTHGLTADVVAKESHGEGLAQTLLQAMGSARGRRVLVLRAKEAREVLPETLRAAGCVVDVVPVYETRPAAVAQTIAALIEQGSLDAITFTSASTVKSLCAVLGDRAPDLLARLKVVSIGPVTTEAAQSLGVRVDRTAAPHTLAGVIQALKAVFLSK